MAVPNTTTRLSHAITIRARGRTIGAIHTWSPSMSRTVDTEFDVDVSRNGMPVDVVPQTVESREINIGRYDLYLDVFEEVFGTTEMAVLSDQVRPIALREFWKGPSTIIPSTNHFGQLANVASDLNLSSAANALNRIQNQVNTGVQNALRSKVGLPIANALGALTRDYRVYEYTGCMFSRIGRNLDAKGDRVVNVDASVTWLERHRIV